jgi:hypothetical protein
MKLLVRSMYVLALGPVMAVPFPFGCFSICVCIRFISIVPVWSEDLVHPETGRSYFRILTRLGCLTSKSVSVLAPHPAGTILSPDKISSCLFWGLRAHMLESISTREFCLLYLFYL